MNKTKNRLKPSVSIVNRLTLLMLFLGVIALVALSTSARIANDTKGSAYMINQLGLLRMKNYQLLSMVPIQPQQYPYLDLFAELPISDEYQQLLKRYELFHDFNQLQADWVNLVPKLKQATEISSIRELIEQNVAKIDALVHAIDQRTESQLVTISRLQILFIIIIILFLGLQIYYLRRHLLSPWQQLLAMAGAISQHDFSERFKLRRKQDEFDLLGQAFNNMSEQLDTQYQRLEDRVKAKTQELQNKNDIVLFLYEAVKLLHTSQPLCERLLVILHQLEVLTPLRHFQIRFYETDDLEHYQEMEYGRHEKLLYCQNANCSACLITTKPQQGNEITRFWELRDDKQKYGLLLAKQSTDKPLSDEQEKLMLGIVEQMTLTVILERQVEQQKQYLLMKERSAMARELHDSIAQSLSCLKMYTSCLQMQPDLVNDESINLLKTMRQEINAAYSQLRELITTFRLRVNSTGFYASLLELIDEFEKKLHLTIELDYQLPANLIDSQYAIHLLQIIREALNNIYKHAQASQVSIVLASEADQVISLTVSDNGVGIPKDRDRNKSDHYGLTIMKDRAELLNGYFSVVSQPNMGTKIMLTFKGANTGIDNVIPVQSIEE